MSEDGGDEAPYKWASTEPLTEGVEGPIEDAWVKLPGRYDSFYLQQLVYAARQYVTVAV